MKTPLKMVAVLAAMLASLALVDANTVPLVVTNNCHEIIYPGVGTQHGVGPGTGGFKLGPGQSAALRVSWDWAGRVWGRTNCSFNADGTGPSQLNGVNGNGAACFTGDCFGVINCTFTGAIPSTLAEFNLVGGANGRQTFYDISLVDGYNLPMGIVHLPSANTSFIPPNLTNGACIATPGWLWRQARTDHANSSYPVPWEHLQDNDGLARWCPWDLQLARPAKPGDGVYPYPDDNVERPVFDPCLSACAATGDPADCCTGPYNNPTICHPNRYSQSAKAVCPDAYSFAFDDQTSTFIVPSGGGWEVVFCPAGRSTDILATFGEQMRGLTSNGDLSRQQYAELGNLSYIEAHESAAPARHPRASWPALLFALPWLSSQLPRACPRLYVLLSRRAGSSACSPQLHRRLFSLL